MQDTKNLTRGIYIFLGVTAVVMVITTALFVASGGRPQAQIAAAPTQGPTATRVVLPDEAAGRQFLEENASAEGVVTTASGLQYKVVTKGDSTERPTADSTVTVHYRGTLVDGTEFDSSYRRGQPATFSLRGVIAGWTEGLQLMSPGDTFMFYIPPELAYGDRAQGQLITPNSTLIFEVELLSIN